MVTVDYSGRTGNHLFQYTMARLVAEHNDQAMTSQLPANDFLRPTPYEVNEPSLARRRPRKIGDGEKNLPNVKLDFHGAHLHGFFQKASYYNPYRERIRKFWNVPPIENKNTKDLVVHLRLTDYYLPILKSVISPMWYYKILTRERTKRDKIYIVVEPHPTNEVYLRHFKPYEPIIVSKSAAEDFHFIRSFDTIVCSNSTFCWWATFLSDASTIYTFKPWLARPTGTGPDLAGIEGATVVDGTFYRNRELEAYDWNRYWGK